MHESTVRDDLRYDFDPDGLPAFIKVGGEYRGKNNNLDTFKEAITSAPWGLNSSTIYPGSDPRTNLGGFPNIQIREEQVQSFYQNQSSYGQTLTAATTYGGAFRAFEGITAAYAMGGLTVDKLKIMAGSRFEATHFWIDGWQIDSTTGVISPVIYEKNYNNALPSVVLTYEFTPNTIARASWSNTLARPDYSDTAPGRAINDSARQVTQGNASLPPLTAVNWDASLEHYYSPLGMVSVAVYYKSLTNFDYLSQAGIDPATGYLLTTYLNGPSAWVYGTEANWNQKLGFLPAPFNGLGVQLSGILGNSAASYPTRPGETIPFSGFAKVGGNAALTYDHAGLHLRVAMHYHGKRLESGSTIGTDATQDQYEAKYTTVDFGSSYTFKQHWQIYLDGSNLNDAPLKEYYGGTGNLIRLQTYEHYGWAAESGVRWIY
jgi:TonB-dependent receptor